MDDTEAQRARILASNRLWRSIFAAVAVALPLTLFLLFGRHEGRLRALAAHGQAATATLTRVNHQDTGTFAEYLYAVDGQSYTSSVAAEKAPYRPGETFPITYLPEDPSLSRPGREYSNAEVDAEIHPSTQHRAEAGIFVLFAAFALLCERGVRKMRRGEPLRAGPRIAPATMGYVVAGLLYAVLLGVNLDPKVAVVQAKVFGVAPLGLPLTPVMIAAQMALFAPIFPLFAHLMPMVVAWQARGGSAGRIGVVLAVVHAEESHRRSRAIVVAGFAYFVALMAAWIAVTAYRGV